MDERELTGTNVDVDVRVVEEGIGHLLNFSWPGGKTTLELILSGQVLGNLSARPAPSGTASRPPLGRASYLDRKKVLKQLE